MSDKDKKNKDIARFASLIAHQLKSPVSAAGSIIKTLLGEYAGSLNPKQKDLLLRADKRLTEAADTSRRMISIVNPDTAKNYTNTTTDLCLIIRHCHSIYSEEAAINGISFNININFEPAIVKATESALTEILNSLISNAIKYTPSNGIINIELDKADHNQVRLIVSDSGIGIPQKNIEKIFQPFFRSTDDQNSTLPGSGIGLAFTKNIITALDGTIKAGKSHLGGAKFVVELNLAEEEQTTNSLSRENISSRKRVVIIGGVAAGPKVASKIIRLAPQTEVTIIEKNDLLAYSGCGLPFYVAGVIKKKTELLSTAVQEVRDPVFFQKVKNVSVLNRTEAIKIDKNAKKVLIQNLQNKNKSWVEYDKLVLATGSYPMIPKTEGINLKNIFTLHGVQDAEGIKSFLSGHKARDVAIIGGGLIGVEMTEALVMKGCRVTIIEKFPHIFNILDEEMSMQVEKHLEEHGVKVLTNTSVIRFQGNDNKKVKKVIIEDDTISADMVVIATGVRPKVDLALDAGLEIGSTGAIKVDKKMKTSDPNIYAAGDCAEKFDMITKKPCYIPLGSTANKEGRVAALNICDESEIFPGILGATTCKVFDYCIARTGLTENEAIEKGYEVITSLTAGPNKEHFMPNVKTIMLKLIVDRKTRKVLGAQSIGDSDGFNKIDIISTAITGGITIDQISNLDLCYAPSYSLAIDNIITAANVIKNKINDEFETISAKEVHNKIQQKEQFVLLDVRSHKEYEELRIPGSTLIPLGILRNRLYELSKEHEIITFCSISLRGYEAALILKAAGFNNVKVMDGGILMWPYGVTEGLQ